MSGETRSRRWLAPEVVQTSAMDCGPAALKCLLEGFEIPVSYGRLREACQTDVDGTSIDTIEVVANQLGIVAEQMLLPVDHLFLTSAETLPALIVVNQPNGGTHFVVVWRRLGPWLQVMDPSTGRSWVRRDRFTDEIYRHAAGVPAAEWRDWASSDAFLKPLRERLTRAGAGGQAGAALIEKALADPGWFSLGALDASLRLIDSLRAAGGVGSGAASCRLLTALFEQTLGTPEHIFRFVPAVYWMATPDPASLDATRQRLILRGAVLLRVSGRRADAARQVRVQDQAALSAELAAALRERPARPLRLAWDLVKGEGMPRLALLGGALGLSVGALLIETLLFRGLFDIATMLRLASQRLGAIIAVVLFSALLLLMEIPIVTESMRIGRHLEIRLRMALLRKLPRLSDRYFQSRQISDMADRGHAIHHARLLPSLASNAVQSVCELVLTLIGIALIDPASTWIASAIVVAAVAIPAAIQPLIRERDLRVRNHIGALGGFYLDALLGLVPVRAHRAERAVCRLHEGLVAEWVRASRRVLGLSVIVDAAQSLLCLGLAGLLLVQHFWRAGGVTGADLLLVFWTLKLPAIGHGLTLLAHQIPAQQNALGRLLEPLSAPDDESADQAAPRTAEPFPHASCGTGIAIEHGAVIASGHTILRDIDLTIRPGEHVAIVGPSGAGKSTLVGLLLGWHRLSEGTMRIDGAPLTSDRQEALRRVTAWVDPAIQLWNRPFAENLGYSSADGGLSRIGQAIDAAQLRGVLRHLPDGMQTLLGEGGALLSGGEGQRVRLGRAFTQDGVRLALLDEPFRGMDRNRRSALLADARTLWAGVTLLCVTHDISETALFDRVLVVEDGRIVEDGTPGGLAGATSRYQTLLNVERVMLDGMWESDDWRHVAIRDGRAMELS